MIIIYQIFHLLQLIETNILLIAFSTTSKTMNEYKQKEIQKVGE